MRERIVEKLSQAAQAHGVRVLFACESGSRAWGFASPDSDYDVRFVFVHPRRLYLRIQEPADTITEIDDVTTIDLAGWELRKALRLFASGNIAIYEWLGSPISYAQVEDFAAKLRELIPAYFNAKRAMHHYLGTAKSVASQYLDGDRIGIKKAFYILRPLAAAAWIRDHGTMPPTEFAAIIAGNKCPRIGELDDEVAALLERKANAVEREPITLPPGVAAYFRDAPRELERAAAEAPVAPTRSMEALDALFRAMLRE